ncbi:unnamed protein product [Lota lota]
MSTRAFERLTRYPPDTKKESFKKILEEPDTPKTHAPPASPKPGSPSPSDPLTECLRAMVATTPSGCQDNTKQQRFAQGDRPVTPGLLFIYGDMMPEMEELVNERRALWFCRMGALGSAHHIQTALKQTRPRASHGKVASTDNPFTGL